jgi:large repetitive protein
MAVRVWREWLAVSLVLVVGACSGKSGKHDDDPMGTGGSAPRTGQLPPGQTSPGNTIQPVGGTTFVGSAGQAPVPGGGFSFGGEAGAAPDFPGAGGADEGVPSIVVSAPGDHMVHESYGMMQVQLRLTAPPRSAVKVELLSTDPTHAVVSPLSLTFSPENWDAPQAAIVVGVRDSIADDGNTVTIETLPAVSKDSRYNGLDAADFDVFVIDETEPGIVVGPTTGGVTTESGSTMTFNIVLTSQPIATVTIPLSSSDPGEGSVTGSVVFNTDDWSTPHPVTVTGVDDQVSDGNQPYSIITGQVVSDDLAYAGVDAADVELVNVDNE